MSDGVSVPPGPPPGGRTNGRDVSTGRAAVEPPRHRQFKIQYCLGRGGYGEVYRATMTSPGGLKAEVAVKLLRLDVTAHDDAVRRLRDEGRMLGLLQHPSILKVYDLAVLDGRVGLVTEYVDGADVLTVFGAIPDRALVEVVARVAEGLDAAWNHVPNEGSGPLRLVHRDIKPSNVRLGRHGDVKILDFGIARSTAEGADREARTGTGSTVGSLAYMAPERFTRAPPSPASDVHALGCVLFEGLSGRRLFEDPVPVEMFRLAADPIAYAEHVEQAWRQLPPTLSPALSNLMAQMVSHGPLDRPTANEVARLAEGVAEQLPGPTLRSWARDFVWPRPTVVQGGWFDGRTITEGSQSDTHVHGLPTPDDRSSDTFRIEVPGATPPAPAARVVPPAAPAPEPAAPATSRRSVVGVLAVLVLVLALGFAGWLAWRDATTPPRPRIERPRHPAPVPAPADPAPAPVAPTPEPAPVAPAPVGPDPVPIAPAPQPHPVAPAPDPQPVAPAPPDPQPVAPAPVEPAPVPTGRVRVINPPGRVELRRGDRVVVLPAVVEAAPDWQIWADFGTGLHKLGFYVQVVPDLETVVRCNGVTYNCTVD